MSNIIGCIVEISSLISTRIRFPRMLHVTGQEGSKILGHLICLHHTINLYFACCIRCYSLGPINTIHYLHSSQLVFINW